MIKVTRVIALDGSTDAEYTEIKTHIEHLLNLHQGWQAKYEPLIRKVTVMKTEEVSNLQ